MPRRGRATMSFNAGASAVLACTWRPPGVPALRKAANQELSATTRHSARPVGRLRHLDQGIDHCSFVICARHVKDSLVLARMWHESASSAFTEGAQIFQF